MPIQIKELIVRATIIDDSGGSSQAGNTDSSSSSVKVDQELLIRQCVDEVLEILRMKKEP